MDPGLEKLEFHRILQRVASLAGSQPGKSLVMALQPASSREGSEVLRLETLHGARLLELSIEPGVSGLEPIITSVTDLENGALALEPFLLRGTGEALLSMERFASATAAVRDDLPGILHEYTEALPDLGDLAERLLRITTPDGELSPSASPELKRLSRRIDSLRSSLASRLSSICAKYAGTGILRDAPPTVRSGRHVIPVSAARRGSVKGLIHDRSESGATLFIEPSELVEAGNEVQEAVFDLEQERRRILREITLVVRNRLEPIKKGIDIFTRLDHIYARARYHREWNTAFPDEGPVDLRGLAHPLLPVETAVRSDVTLPDTWKVLVVSGPNAGGKSVLLKALALASVCSRAGLGAHVRPSSSIPFFSSILVSMGDNQSIAMHLSTYSARLSEQMEILEKGGNETLAIVDEPAAGTDPSTGAALASVFLRRTAEAGVRSIVSTHMGQLKLLAMDHPGFINGSMSFNPETLTPGFRFIPDLPGASCTLEAAAIAGFPRDLLNEASELAGDSFSLDSLVASLRELQEERRAEIKALSLERTRAEESRKTLEEQLGREKNHLAEATRKATEEKEEKLRKIQSEADSLLTTMANAPEKDRRLRARRMLSDLARRESVSREETSGDSPPPAPGGLQRGDTVTVRGWTETGTVENLSRSTAMVRMGAVLMKKDLTELTRVEPGPERTTGTSEYAPIEESPEAMLIGLTVDEAVAELDIKLDNCTALGLRRLRVVHGRGRLMRGVTEWLRHDRRVRSVSIAPPEEGGTGASVVLIRG